MIYIAFEGIDGCGKTKQLELLNHYLLTKNKTTLVTKEIGSPHNEACLKLRELILNANYDLDDLAAQFLLAAGSIQHSLKVLAPNIDKYDYILSDRSVESNLAYSHVVYGKPIHLFDKRRIFPDIVIYLDIDPLIAQERILKRNPELFQNNGEDRIEKRGLDFQKQVRKNFLARANRNEYIVIDATQSIQQTHFQIIERLDL